MIPDAAAAPHVLREYALIADGQRGALVGPRGDLSWRCVPGWDSYMPRPPSSEAKIALGGGIGGDRMP